MKLDTITAADAISQTKFSSHGLRHWLTHRFMIKMRRSTIKKFVLVPSCARRDRDIHYGFAFARGALIT
jgi:hypothetical protein